MQTVIKRLITVIKEKNIKKVTLLGHDNIDEDSCISAILLQYALKHYGIEGEIKILDRHINEQTLKVLKKLGYDMNVYLTGETTDEECLVLVDHYCTRHKGIVVGCIDHHPTAQSFNYPIYENDKASACCKKIYDDIIEDRIPMNKQLIKAVVYGTMIDTFAFKSSRGKLEDKMWVEDMVKQYELDYAEMYNDALSLTDLKQSVEELAMTNLKSYEFNSYKVKSTYIQVDKEPSQLAQIIDYLKEKVQKEALAMWVFLLVDVSSVRTIEYRIDQRDWVKVEHSKLTSRAQGIMPEIEKIFIKTIEKSS